MTWSCSCSLVAKCLRMTGDRRNASARLAGQLPVLLTPLLLPLRLTCSCEGGELFVFKVRLNGRLQNDVLLLPASDELPPSPPSESPNPDMSTA